MSFDIEENSYLQQKLNDYAACVKEINDGKKFHLQPMDAADQLAKLNHELRIPLYGMGAFTLRTWLREMYIPVIEAPAYQSLILSDNGYGKRTDVDAYRLQIRGGKGIINMKTYFKIGKVPSINLVNDITKRNGDLPIRQDHPLDSNSVCFTGSSTSGVCVLHPDTNDKVASATLIPPKTPKSTAETPDCRSSNRVPPPLKDAA